MRRPALILATLALLGCASREPEAPTTPPADGEQALVLRLDKPVRLDAGRLEVVWLDLNDSRCPIGVTCVWEGDVSVGLRVTEQGREPTSVELALRPGAVEAAAVALEAWRLELLSVDPYPREDARAEREDFRAAVAVTRLD